MFSKLFNLLLGSIEILSCFLFLFCVVFGGFSMIPLVNENTKLKLALAIDTGAPITLKNDGIENSPLFTDKAIKDFSK